MAEAVSGVPPSIGKGMDAFSLKKTNAQMPHIIGSSALPMKENPMNEYVLRVVSLSVVDRARDSAGGHMPENTAPIESHTINVQPRSWLTKGLNPPFPYSAWIAVTALV